MEICNSIGAVKYLFKYVYKGIDKIEFSLENLNNRNDPGLNLVPSSGYMVHYIYK